MSIIHALSASSGRLKRLTIGAGRNRGGRKGKSLSDKKLRLTRSRLVILAATFSLAYVAIFGKLAYYGMTPDDAGSAIPPAPTVAFRPDIVDRNGQILATDIRTVSMYAEPYRVVDPDEAVEKLASIFPDLDRKALFQKLSDKRSHFAWLRRQLTPKEQSEVLGLGLPAIGFRPDVRRFYPGGRTAAHIVGYVDIDNHGVAGMEKYIDQQGMSDLAATGLTSTDDLKPVKLSIDLRVQNIVHDVVADAIGRYQAQAAGAVILDIHTGEVLAMASVPDYDPNDPQADGGKGWLNRMSGGTDEMGSVFKTFSIAMALDTGKVTLNDTFDASAPLHYGRFTIHDDRDVPRRILSIPEIFRYSSNVAPPR